MRCSIVPSVAGVSAARCPSIVSLDQDGGQEWPQPRSERLIQPEPDRALPLLLNLNLLPAFFEHTIFHQYLPLCFIGIASRIIGIGGFVLAVF